MAVHSVDIVVLDTGLQKTVPAADLHETDYTPWEAHVVTAWPSVTVQRGTSDSTEIRGTVSSCRVGLPTRLAHDRLFERVLPMPNDVAHHTSDLHLLRPDA